MQQVMWVIDYEDDIASDLSAFHRVDDPMTLPAVRYFSLALRLAAYTGVLQARVTAEERERRGETSETPTGYGRPADTQRRTVPDSAVLGMLADETEWTKAEG